MAQTFKDRVMVVSTTTGTGTYTLGSAVTGYQTFAIIGDGNTAYYAAEDVDVNGVPTGGWEVGIGTYATAGTTLARTSILASTNANAAVSWAAGTRRVFVVAPATWLTDPRFASGDGLSFEGAGANPVTMVGGAQGGDTAIVIDNAGAAYAVLKFPNYVDFFMDGGGSITAVDGASIYFDYATSQIILHADDVAATQDLFDANSAIGIHWAFAARMNWDRAEGAWNTDFGLGVASAMQFGGTTPSKGTLSNFTAATRVVQVADADSEYVMLNGRIEAEIGTGFTQTTSPVGNLWGTDLLLAGGIAVQPGKLLGNVTVVNNHYNGSPSGAPSSGMVIATVKGQETNGTLAAANTYPIDQGLQIVGISDVGGTPGIGFTTGIQVGGTGGMGTLASSKIGTGINIRDYATAGININNASAATAPSIIFDTFLQGTEMTAPSAPAANGFRIYAVDAAGKTQLRVLFNSGVSQLIAAEP